MVIKKQVEKKSKVQEYDSESESEIEYHYNDDDDDDNDSSVEDNDSDDSETENSENEEIATAKQTHKRKKFKSPKLERFANSGSDDDDDDDYVDDDDDDVANDASSEGDNEEDDDNTMTDQPRKKKRKMSKLEKATDSEDDTESEDDDDNESEKEEEEEEEVTTRKGFANVLSNILSKKTVSSKKVILAQGKTDREIKKLKESKLPQEDKDLKEPFLTAQELEEKKLMRKLWLEKGKVKPNALEKNHERELKMIATRGVVQLFNAVKRQQKMVNENLSSVSSERKKDMVIESMNKKSFINLLQNTKVDVSLGPTEKETPKAKEPERKIWSVLQDDFVIGTGKMKDWDKQESLDAL